jgi:hypothetical protein
VAHGNGGDVDSSVLNALVRTKFNDSSEAKGREKMRGKRRNNDGGGTRQPVQRLGVEMVGILIAEQDEIGVGKLGGREAGSYFATNRPAPIPQHGIAKHTKVLISNESGGVPRKADGDLVLAGDRDRGGLGTDRRTQHSPRPMGQQAAIAGRAPLGVEPAQGALALFLCLTHVGIALRYLKTLSESQKLQSATSIELQVWIHDMKPALRDVFRAKQQSSPSLNHHPNLQ